MAFRQLISSGVKAPSLYSFVTSSHCNVLSSGLLAELRGKGCSAVETLLCPHLAVMPVCYRSLHQSHHHSESGTKSATPKPTPITRANILQDPACGVHSLEQTKISSGNFSTSKKQLGDGNRGQSGDPLASEESENQWLLKSVGAALLGSYVMFTFFRRKARNELKYAIEEDNLACVPEKDKSVSGETEGFKGKKDRAETGDASKPCSKTQTCLESNPQPPCEYLPSATSSSPKPATCKSSLSLCQKPTSKSKKMKHSCKTCESANTKISKTPCIICPPPPACRDPAEAIVSNLMANKGGPCTDDMCLGKRKKRTTKCSCEGLDDDDYVIL